MHLHRRLGVVLQTSHVLHHPLDVFQHIAASDLEQLMLSGRTAALTDPPAVQRLGPGLHGGALVVAQSLQLVQGHTGLHQTFPAVESRTRVEQFGLPMLQLSRQISAQIEVAVDHVVDDAQHHVGGAGGHAPSTGRAQVGGLLQGC